MSLSPEVRRGGNLPFGMVAALWMCDPRYSSNARTLYSILVTYADTQERHTQKGKPYRAELAAQLGVSLSTLDRTLLEMEVAGIVTVENRPDPANPLNHDSNVYHLHDAGVMWQGNGTWRDPLPRSMKAADVAGLLTEARRAEKARKGVKAKGGVPKGVSSKAVKAARETGGTASGQTANSEGGGSTHAATPGSTDAARVAAPTLPNVYSPDQSPDPEPSFGDGRRPTAGSSGSRPGGSAASGKTNPSPITREQRQQVAAFFKALPKNLADLVPDNPPANLKTAVLEALAVDKPEERTPQQLIGYRLMPKWDGYYASKDQAGPLERPVGVLITLLQWNAECGDDRCDERTNVDTGQSCISCEQKAVNNRADRAPRSDTAAQVPRQEPAPQKETFTPASYVPEPVTITPGLPSDIVAQARAAVTANRGRNRVTRMP
ncbi:hypothetical protein [Streptomyces sp. NPDC005548]|uniref:hypothetical protein n=1 Tax=Streptomyces sp. NPDC005548 TaxID=3364724 RepID=UPI0036C65B86